MSAKVLPPKEIRKVMQVATQTLRIFFPAASAGRYQRKWQNKERQLLFCNQIPQYFKRKIVYLESQTGNLSLIFQIKRGYLQIVFRTIIVYTNSIFFYTS